MDTNNGIIYLLLIYFYINRSAQLEFLFFFSFFQLTELLLFLIRYLFNFLITRAKNFAKTSNLNPACDFLNRIFNIYLLKFFPFFLSKTFNLHLKKIQTYSIPHKKKTQICKSVPYISLKRKLSKINKEKIDK